MDRGLSTMANLTKGAEFAGNAQDDTGRFYYRATIDLGSDAPQRPCIMWDISESGARLSAETVHGLPDIFVVLLTTCGNVRRLCHVQSRFDNQVSVRFLPQDTSKSKTNVSDSGLCEGITLID